MTTVGTYIRPLFPGLTLPDTTRVGLQRAIPVGPAGSQARVALASVRPGETFLDTDWMTVSWDDTQTLGDTPLVTAILDDSFDGTTLGAAWTAVEGNPTVSGGRLHLSNAFPQSQFQSVAHHSFIATTMALLGFTSAYGTSGDGYKGRGVLVQDVSNPGLNFVQYVRQGMSWLCRTNPGTTAAFPYDPVAHANIRIREAAGQTYFETSPNAATWTVLRQVANPAWMASAQVWISPYGGAYNSAGSDPTTEATIDRITWQ